MSKTSVPGALAANYLLETSTLAIGIRITRTDNAVYGLTTSDKIDTVAGVQHIPGLQVKNVDITAGLAVDNLELRLLDDTSLITRADALGGVWRNATFVMFEYNWVTPGDGINTLITGHFGELSLGNGQITVELRGLQQALQQTVGAVSSKNCRARLGDSLCRVALAPYTVTGTFTGVNGKQIFTDTARTEADDWFTDGILTFTSGPCINLSQKVKAYSADTFTLSLPMILQPAVGNTYSVIAGCRKRLTEDCIGKFNNVVNFQGEPHLPGTDALTKPVNVGL